MEKVTKEEVEKIALIPAGGATAKHQPINQAINALEIGEGLLVKKEEYHGKTKFVAYIRQAFRKERTQKEIFARTLADESGWLVISNN